MARNDRIAPDTARDATEAVTRNDDEPKKLGDSFRILDVRATDVVLEMEDGRAFVATLGDGVKTDDLRRGMVATITSDGLDRSEAPKDAVVTRAVPKSEA